MAARINKKRAFLFVSKVLGKHLPVQPAVSLVSGFALALLLQRELSGVAPDPRLIVEGLLEPATAADAYRKLKAQKWTPPRRLAFIGFAETATALGHSMYDAFAEGCRYLHTTRELIPELTSTLNFEEEHSHATAHRCYAEHPVQGQEAIVLVDDEMTTGKTVLNIIRDLYRQYPAHKNYYVAALLDWRTEEHRARFSELEQELGITIKTLALIKGEMSSAGDPHLSSRSTDIGQRSAPAALEIIRLPDLFERVSVSSLDSAGNRHAAPFLRGTGRFGIESADNEQLDRCITQAAEWLRAKRTGDKTLCLGTGEFMYLPMRIAAEMGAGVHYQSTTRSPIYPSSEGAYTIWEAFRYPSPEDANVQHHLYNVTRYDYDEVFVMLERQVEAEQLQPFLDVLVHLGIKRVYVVMVS
ncbi:hypothetical protein CIG75_02940 [Tumebacillus algifaecis]|uniref:Phosphoribosyltransferase n=2 Tax=Tumebacillus algifaecis TaxID=1214604 RepID=A0A223D666_9BACL|nr:hypothetical protein CIG75_02940 [Tumebacillus algifaecis]